MKEYLLLIAHDDVYVSTMYEYAMFSCFHIAVDTSSLSSLMKFLFVHKLMNNIVVLSP